MTEQSRSPTVRNIPTKELYPNPHNPRMLFDKKPLAALKDSIARSGILVPVTVYQATGSGRYVILDGQRRWMCALELEQPSVPANIVAEPTLVENIVTMFQIHKLRRDWELMPTALKVELLMKELEETNDKRLAVLTGLDEAVVVRCKKLISYDKTFQDMMLDPDPDKRMKADFFIELYVVIHDRDVTAYEWFKENTFIRQMLRKYFATPRTIRAVTDFRVIKQHLTNARRVGAKRHFGERLRAFAEDPKVPLDTLDIREANVHAKARKYLKHVKDLDVEMGSLDVDQLFGEEELWVAVGRLIDTLEKVLKRAGKRRLS